MIQSKNSFFGLMLGSIGVVYGDIGTSPLYAFREALAAAGSHESEVVIGLLSLIFWTLIVIVTLKYVVVLLRADNSGEGGILALMTLAQKALGRGNSWLILLGMIGAGLFYGDAIITPAISVLSAVEGLKLVTSDIGPYVVSIAAGILIALFLVQSHGTERMGVFFGPLTLLWFLVLGWGGLMHISDDPNILKAISPHHAVQFMLHHGYAGLIALGAVFLTVTGAEALYADLGHYGKKPIQYAWVFVVMPCLMLNYFGQGALVLAHPEAAESPFYMLYPDWALLPVVIIATIATIIASQAVISGAYSMTHQAMQLGILPRFHVEYTSEDTIGQIYIPQINWLLMVGVLLLIVFFRSSESLASAYGIAVTGTMITTSLLLFVVMRHVWKLALGLCLLVVIPLLAVETVFMGANLTKLFHGGYIPLVLSFIIVFLMRTWVMGNQRMREQVNTKGNSISEVLEGVNKKPPVRVQGTAIYITHSSVYAPIALIQNIRHNRIIHDENILLDLEFVNQPYVFDTERVTSQVLSPDFRLVTMRFGYMEPPRIMRGLRLLSCSNFQWDSISSVYFISRRTVMESSGFGMPIWRDRIFIYMANISAHIGDYVHLPFSRVVEIGARITV